jgi:hypothetical protein
MKPFVWLALASVLAAGCSSGGSHAASSPMTPDVPQGTGARMIPYALPFRTDAAIEAARTAGRTTQNSVGNVPTVVAAQVPVTVGLVDAPLFNLSQVNLALERINAISNLGTAKQTETALAIYPGDAVVDVLNYQTFAAVIASAIIPAGTYDALELVCDPADSTVVTASGQTLPIEFGNFAGGAFSPTSSGHYSIVIPYTFDATFGINDALIDFNVENSINMQSNAAEVSASTFATAALSAGAIGGTLETAAGAPVQNATAVVTNANGTLMGLAPTDAAGNFLVHALPPGTYTLTVYERYVTAAQTTIVASDGKTGSLAPMSVTVPSGYEAFVGTLKD